MVLGTGTALIHEGGGEAQLDSAGHRARLAVATALGQPALL